MTHVSYAIVYYYEDTSALLYSEAPKSALAWQALVDEASHCFDHIDSGTHDASPEEVRAYDEGGVIAILLCHHPEITRIAFTEVGFH